MANNNTIENKNPVKRKPVKKVRTPPIEVHWTQFEVRSLPPKRQQEIADQLMEYVHREHKYTITGFMAEINASHAVWYEWCAKYPIIYAAHERAKRHLGAKRFDAAASRNASDKLLQWAGQYDVDALSYMKLMEEMKAKKDEEKGETHVHIHMTDYSEPQGIEMHTVADAIEEN